MALALACALLLAASNGANDNFKGVATLFGSGVTDYRRALAWGTAATFAGSLAAIPLGAALLATFSGKLFVPAATLAHPGFALAVCAGAALTVALASRLGLPVSTTHALAGALVGAALAIPQGTLDWAAAGRQVFLPLALGPLLALVAALLLYPVLSAVRQRAGLRRSSCVCVGETWVPVGGAAALRLELASGSAPQCRERYAGAVLGIEAGAAIDRLHYLSAALVSFARGLNDTPKIAALLLLALPLVEPSAAFTLVGLAIAGGGGWGARRVARTMAQGITPLNPGQGFTANLITSALLLSASPLGLPLSTTHVSCGALFGIGAASGRAHWRTIGGIVGAWLLTLPLAALLGALLMRAALFTF